MMALLRCPLAHGLRRALTGRAAFTTPNRPDRSNRIRYVSLGHAFLSARPVLRPFRLKACTLPRNLGLENRLRWPVTNDRLTALTGSWMMIGSQMFHSLSINRAVRSLLRPVPGPEPFGRMIHEIDGAMHFPVREFLATYDMARKKFVDSLPGGQDLTLDSALLAVKLLNLLLTKYEYLNKRINKIARPIGFMLDPANGCQLGCATCINTFNREFTASYFNPVPKGIMKEDTFDAFIDDVGLSAFSGHFYNNHEPLLNKKTPAYVKKAANFRVETFISTNLSFSKLNVEALVLSGLKELMVAIDGVTQEVYSKYRRGGVVDLVFDNVRSIVETKRKLGMSTPYLRWQYLTFEHNVCEVEQAIETARDLGFDSFNLATPFDVSPDDPTVHAVTYRGPDKHKAVVFNPYPADGFTNDLSEVGNEIYGRLKESATDRYEELIGNDDDDAKVERSGSDQCDWLHLAVISDARGRVFPCCLGDFKKAGKFVFADVKKDSSNLLNSDAYRSARLLMASPKAYEEASAQLEASERIRCDGCTVRPRPQVGLGAARSYFVGTGGGRLAERFASEDFAALFNWSQHQSRTATTSPLATSGILQFEGEVEPRPYHNIDADFFDANSHEDRCQNRPSASPQEERTGLGEARIIDYMFMANGGVVDSTANIPREIDLVLKVLFQIPVEQPIVGITLHDSDGHVVTAINSAWDGKQCASVQAGDVRWYQFRISLQLQVDNYFLEPAVASSITQVLDRRSQLIGLGWLVIGSSTTNN